MEKTAEGLFEAAGRPVHFYPDRPEDGLAALCFGRAGRISGLKP